MGGATVRIPKVMVGVFVRILKLTICSFHGVGVVGGVSVRLPRVGRIVDLWYFWCGVSYRQSHEARASSPETGAHVCCELVWRPVVLAIHTTPEHLSCRVK